MQQKNENHSFTGLQRDIIVSKHPAEFLYDAKNIRLTSREEDTLFAITNEKGTVDTKINLTGVYLGHCILSKYLIVFTTNQGSTKPDYIYKINLEEEKLYILCNDNLNFSTNNPIDTTIYYESEDIQKVYWVDGINPLRVINIMEERTKDNPYNSNSFNIIPELALNEIVDVRKQFGGGNFPAGVIQYAFTYYNKFKQESNIFHVTPLHYISNSDRGGSPEESVSVSFKIKIANVDNNFDYIRVYSILRTSLNGTPIVKRVQDISIKEAYTLDDEESNDITYDEILGYTRLEYSDNAGLSFININEISDDENIAFCTIKQMLKDVQGDGSLYDFITNFVTTDTDLKYIKITATTDTVIKSDNYFYFPKNAGDFFYMIVGDNTFKIIGVKRSSDVLVVSTDITKRNTLYSPLGLTGVSIVDSGTIGENIDPTELLYKNKTNFSCKTLAQKDNTLFLGNIDIKQYSIEEFTNAITNIKENYSLQSVKGIRNYKEFSSENSVGYFNTLYPVYDNSPEYPGTSCFKSNEYYRLGLQLQDKYGTWSEPIWLKDIKNTESSSYKGDGRCEVPEFKCTISSIQKTLFNYGYRRIRPLFVIPEVIDRTVLFQGIACPTVYRKADRFLTGNYNTNNVYEGTGEGSLYAQSSWLFRAVPNNTDYNNGGKASNNGGYVSFNKDTSLLTWEPKPSKNSILDVTDSRPSTTLEDLPYINSTEVMGSYKDAEGFYIDADFITMHSPDIEVNSELYNLDLSYYKVYKYGDLKLGNTYGSISIQLENPTIGGISNDFNKNIKTDGGAALVSGFFFEDNIVTTSGDSYIPYKGVGSQLWAVYMWHRKRSLNNDAPRQARSSLLRKKIISNYRNGTNIISSNTDTEIKAYDIKIFNSDELSLLKVYNKPYMGNIDTSLTTSVEETLVCYNDNYQESPSVHSFTLMTNDTGQTSTLLSLVELNDNTKKWKRIGKTVYDTVPNAREGIRSKESLRMRYKSSPHAVLYLDKTSNYYNSEEHTIPILEIRKPYNKDIIFGGQSQDALQNNRWIPCGPSIKINDNTGDLILNYKWGDTYFQKFETLKTYPFSNDDLNQVIEIAGFLCETRVNIDGRYDRNRGNNNNLHVNPTNFNLINPVYSQLDNFFIYRITDKDKTQSILPHQITWSKEKQSGADIDLYTDFTLASSYALDGASGEIKALRTFNDTIYCFQENAISTILFNSRVQIPTSDGVPIEISNNYKVDGYRTISNNMGINSLFLIKNTPSGIYFMDNISNKLMHLGSELSDITTTHKMTSWFKKEGENIKSLLYDDINSDLYLVKEDEALCFSEALGQFTSLMDYGNMQLLESYNNHVFSLHGNNIYKMFEGNYNYFFTEHKPWEITFISNGLSNGDNNFDKIFSNIDYRMDAENSTEKLHDVSLNYMRVSNDYQDTNDVELKRFITNNKYSNHSKDSNLQKKFRIWRIEIPRNANSRDRIRNPWCKITLGCNQNLDNTKITLHDLNVQYYV